MEVDTSASNNSAGDKWVKIKTNLCPGDCRLALISGWLRRSQIALLGDFKPLKSWPRQQEISMVMGDYAGSIQVEKNATFTYSGGVSAENENYPSYSRKGTLYRFRNILWANDGAGGNFFVEQPNEHRFCWNWGDQEASDEENSCFPFLIDSELK